MSILSTSSRLIKVGQDYSAGSGISIDNHVISVTGGTGTTGTMNVSGLEYNSVGEISAYAGSAISQPTLSSLNAANVNNIIVTASLPAIPDANTLYLIPET